MLIMELEYGTSIKIGNDTTLTVHPPRGESGNKEIQINIEAPKQVRILRDDIKKTR